MAANERPENQRGGPAEAVGAHLVTQSAILTEYLLGGLRWSSKTKAISISSKFRGEARDGFKAFFDDARMGFKMSVRADAIGKGTDTVDMGKMVKDTAPEFVKRLEAEAAPQISFVPQISEQAKNDLFELLKDFEGEADLKPKPETPPAPLAPTVPGLQVPTYQTTRATFGRLSQMGMVSLEGLNAPEAFMYGAFAKTKTGWHELTSAEQYWYGLNHLETMVANFLNPDIGVYPPTLLQPIHFFAAQRQVTADNLPGRKVITPKDGMHYIPYSASVSPN